MTRSPTSPPPPPRRYIPAPRAPGLDHPTPQHPMAVVDPHLIVNGVAMQRGMNRDSVLPFFTGLMRVADWSASPSGHNVRLRLVEDLPVHPFRGLVGGGARGQRILLSARDRNGRIIYDDQGLVTWRGDDSINGQAVSIRLDSMVGEHPFAAVESDFDAGARGGEDLAVSAWVVDDDEYLVRPATRFADLSPVTQAQIRCQDRDFIHWAMENAAMLLSLCGGRPAGDLIDAPAAQATALVKTFCGIASRAELGANDRHGFDARMKWRLLLSLYDARPVSRMRSYDRRILQRSQDTLDLPSAG